jgi:hypothetical protein
LVGEELEFGEWGEFCLGVGLDEVDDGLVGYLRFGATQGMDELRMFSFVWVFAQVRSDEMVMMAAGGFFLPWH